MKISIQKLLKHFEKVFFLLFIAYNNKIGTHALYIPVFKFLVTHFYYISQNTGLCVHI